MKHIFYIQCTSVFSVSLTVLEIIHEVIGRNNPLLSFDTTRTAYKTTPQTIIRCRGNVCTDYLPSNDRGRQRQTHRLSFDQKRIAWKMTRPTILLLCVFVAARTFSPSLYLATIGGLYIQTHRQMARIYEVRR
jgi:hypothetical protein